MMIMSESVIFGLVLSKLFDFDIEQLIMFQRDVAWRDNKTMLWSC